MDDNKYIFEVEVDDSDAEDSLKSINALTSQLIKNQTELLEANKKLEEQGKQNSTQYQDNKKQIEENQKAITKNKSEVDNLNKSLKSKNETLEKSKVSMQDFTGALDKAVPGLGGFVNTVVSATKASLAFIATPLGLVLTAVVAALAALGTYFTRTEEGADSLTKVWAQLTAIANVLLDRLAKIGGAFVSLLSGDLIGAFNRLEEAVSGVADEIEREVQAAGELADLLDQLEDREIQYGVAASETVNQIKRLIIESKNRTLSEQEKIDKLTEASNLEIEQNKVLLGIKADYLKAAVKQFENDALTAEGRRKFNESDIDYANRIIGLTNESAGAREKVAKAIIDLNQVEGESLNLQEKISNQIDLQNQKLREKQEALGAARVKEIEDNIAYQQYLDQKQIQEQARLDQEAQAYLDREQRKADGELAIQQQLNADFEAENRKEQVEADKNYQKEVERSKKEIALKKLTEQNKVSLVQQGLSAISSLFNQASEEFKALQIVQTLISTYSSAQRAYESQLIPGDPTSLARAIAAAFFSVISGLGRVAQISKYDQGGQVITIGGKPHSQGGTKFYGDDGTVFEAERGEGLYVMKRDAHSNFLMEQSMRNQKFGGRSWFGSSHQHLALGGVVQQQGQRYVNLDEQLIADLITQSLKQMPNPIVLVEDINTGQDRLAQVQDAATFK